jgi:hypothetical protein
LKKLDVIMLKNLIKQTLLGRVKSDAIHIQTAIGTTSSDKQRLIYLYKRTGEK